MELNLKNRNVGCSAAFKMLLLLAIVFALRLEAIGQNVKRFHDESGLQGEVRYSGVWQDTVLPRSGNIEIKWRELHGSSLKTFYAKGALRSHLPEGFWQWDEADWLYSIEPGAALSPAFRSAGNRYAWEARFANGEAHGAWKLAIDSVSASLQVLKKGLQMLADFNRGQITGKFNVTDRRNGNNFTLSGNCDDRGFATGKWMCRYRDDQSGKTVTEERTYLQGLLIEAVVTKGDSVHAKSFDLTKAQLQSLASDTSTLNFRIGDYEFEDDGWEGVSQTALRHYFNNYFFKGFRLKVFPHYFERKGPLFRKIQYPFLEEETGFISSSDSLIRQMTNEIEHELRCRNMLINRGWSKELDLAVSFTKAALQKFRSADSLFQVSQTPLFTYTNRFDSDASRWLDALNELESVSGVVYDSLQISIPVAEQINLPFQIFKSVHELLTGFNQVLPAQLAIIHDACIALQKEGELQELEDRMTKKLNMLDTLYEPLTGLGAQIRKRWVEDYFRNQLQAYSQAESFEEIKKSGLFIIDKMNILIEKAGEWERFDNMLREWNEQFTYYAFNPYNGKHDIAIRIKKRFYNKTAAQLHPWLLEEFAASHAWNDFISHFNLAKEFHHDMLAFAKIDDKSSKRFEKRYRKEPNPERMAKMLHHFMRNR